MATCHNWLRFGNLAVHAPTLANFYNKDHHLLIVGGVDHAIPPYPEPVRIPTRQASCVLGQRVFELTKSTLKKSMEQDFHPNNIEMHPNIGQLYQSKVSEIGQLLIDQASHEESISLIRSLIKRIDITQGETRGQPQVQLIGGLAAILEFAVAKQQKTAIPSDSGFGRVFMVAGAGFVQDPTIKKWL